MFCSAMATFPVNQSGTTVQISSTAAGFTKNSANQYYLNSSNQSLSTDSFVITFSDGASIRLTEFSEIPFNGSSSTESVVGIPATAEGSFTNSINLIGGFGSLSTFDIYDNTSGSLLIDNYVPQQVSNGFFQPYAQFGYSSGSLTVGAPGGTISIGISASIQTDGTGSLSPSNVTYRGGAGGTQGSQFVSGGGASPWIFSLSSPTPVPICFVEGTLIHVGGGVYNQIEDLKTGNWIETSRGIKRIKWVARKHYPHSIIKLFPQVLPIRFKIGALGKEVPTSDLLVSRSHGMFIHGMAVAAVDLVNGISIEQCSATDYPQGITYYHLEFEENEIINAQGALSTTFYSIGNRSEFDNAFEYKCLYGNLDAVSPMTYRLITNKEIREMRRMLAKMAMFSDDTYFFSSYR